MSPPRLVIFTRFPEPGKAKTRLIPLLGADGAAALHRMMTERTVEAARASGLEVEVRTTGAPPSAFAHWLGADLRFVGQGEGDLGARLARAAEPVPVLFIGSDLPDLTTAHLVEAAARMRSSPAVVGPAEDGGYWALGLHEPAPFVFENMPWGTDRVFHLTFDRLQKAGIEPTLLPVLRDCDLPEDLSRWPHLASFGE